MGPVLVGRSSTYYMCVYTCCVVFIVSEATVATLVSRYAPKRGTLCVWCLKRYPYTASCTAKNWIHFYSDSSLYGATKRRIGCILTPKKYAAALWLCEDDFLQLHYYYLMLPTSFFSHCFRSTFPPHTLAFRIHMT